MTQSVVLPTLDPGDLVEQFVKKGHVEREGRLPGSEHSELSFGHAKFQISVEIFIGS